jgi:hypothetical protein
VPSSDGRQVTLSGRVARVFEHPVEASNRRPDRPYAARLLLECQAKAGMPAATGRLEENPHVL